jgi:putative transcriptional regulator
MTEQADKAMTKAAFEKIKAGLEEAKAYLDGSGDTRDFQVHVPERKGKRA